jgi:hypothetical protein
MTVPLPWVIIVFISLYFLARTVPDKEWLGMFSMLFYIPKMGEDPVLHFAKSAMLLIFAVAIVKLLSRTRNGNGSSS